MITTESYRDTVICEGTLKNSDLIRAFSRVLAETVPEAYAAIFEDAEYRAVRHALSIGDDYAVDYGEFDNIAENLVSDLDVELGANAPDGYYFGTPEGDGACFGFWPLDEDDR